MINYNVPLNKKHINANIEIKILEEHKMRELGFTDYCKDTWTYRENWCSKMGILLLHLIYLLIRKIQIILI